MSDWVERAGIIGGVGGERWGVRGEGRESMRMKWSWKLRSEKEV